MQSIDLYFNGFESRAELHMYLENALDLPPYYGCNLDALHSELVSVTETTVLHVYYTPESTLFSSYVQKALTVFRDAALENPRLTVTVSDPMEDYGFDE